jgi:hypothetical protein
MRPPSRQFAGSPRDPDPDDVTVMADGVRVTMDEETDNIVTAPAAKAQAREVFNGMGAGLSGGGYLGGPGPRQTRNMPGTSSQPAKQPATKPAAKPATTSAPPAATPPAATPTTGPSLPRDVQGFTQAFYASQGQMLNNLARDVAARLPSMGIKNPRVTVGVSAGVINGKMEYRVTVSDPAAWEALRKHQSELPQGLEIGPAPKMVDGRLDPMRHVEVEGPLGLIEEGAQGVVVGTNRPACKGSCEPQWGQPGSPPNVWHTHRQPTP